MGKERAPKQKAVVLRRRAVVEKRPQASPAPEPVVVNAGNALAAFEQTMVPAGVVDALASERGVPMRDADRWAQQLGRPIGQPRLVNGVVAAQAAAAIGARAFTVGDRVFFGAGNDAETDDGRLLAHELVHVAQQLGAPPPASWADLPFATDDEESAARRNEADRGATHRMAIARDDQGSVDASHFYDALGGVPMELRAMFLKEVPGDHDAIGRGPWGQYLSYAGGFYSVFKDTLWDESVKSKIASYITPDSLWVLVDRARPHDWEQKDPDQPPRKLETGPLSYLETPVRLAIANALVRHYNESIQRMFPRAAAITFAKNPALSTPDHPLSWNTVQEEDIPISHPLDVLVRKGLVAAQMTLHQAYYILLTTKQIPRAAGDLPQTTDPTTLDFAPEGKLWHWVKASPPDSTREQVATVLFGTPEHAFRLIANPPLWGFRTRDIENFEKHAYEALGNKVDKARNAADPADRPAPDVQDEANGDLRPEEFDIDPVAELAAAHSPAWAVTHYAQGGATKPATAPAEVHDELNVFDSEKSLLKSIDTIDKLVPMFGPTYGHRSAAINAARSRFKARFDAAQSACLAHPEEMYQLAEKQRGQMARISVGIGDAGSRLILSGGNVAPDSVKIPLTEVVDAYLAGLEAIELPEFAEPRILEAETLTRNLDITLQEMSLYERIGELDAEIDENREKPDALIDPSLHEDKLEAYITQLSDARISMRTDPAGTQKQVLELQPKVDDLGFEIGIGEKLARLNALWDALDKQEDVWESGLAYDIGRLIKQQNRALYERFRDEVYTPFTDAQKAGDATGKRKARDAYSVLLTGPQMKEHVDTVRDFLAIVAKQKKWTKVIVGIAIAFVAFGLGQWEYGAVLAGGGSVFEAAVAAGVVSTTVGVVLNKVILNQNPTLLNVLLTFLGNAGTFFVVGKLAIAARAAGAEAAVSEGTQTTAQMATKLAGELALNTVVGTAMGAAQQTIETLAAEHRFPTPEEYGEIALQALVASVAMHVFTAVTPKDLFQYTTPEMRIKGDIDWLKGERKALSERADAVSKAAKADPTGKADRGAIMDVLDRWKKYLERERATREKILDYAEKHPGKFTAAEIESVRAGEPDPTLVRQLREAKAILAIEPDGVNRYSCAAGALDTVIAQHRAVGNEIIKVETDPQTGQRTITVRPKDGTTPFEITERVPPKGMRTAAKVPVGSARHFEAWLGQRGLSLTPVEGQQALVDLYARDPATAINLASEKYGYEPVSMPERELLVKPDAPGAAKEAPVEPFVTLADKQLAANIGYGVIAVGEGRFRANAAEMRGMRKNWKVEKGTEPSQIHYDPETNTSHFEAELGGETVRVEAELAPRIEMYPDLANGRNQVIGGGVSRAVGEDILRAVALGQPEAVKAAGLGGEPNFSISPTIEFGLGKTTDGYVIVIGEPSAVDWSALPGIEPAGHTHPLHPGNDLQGDIQNQQQVPVTELVTAHKDAHVNRELVFPSAQDFVVMADLKFGGAKVFTGFVVENGVVRKPMPNENLPTLEFTIGETRQVGMKDGKRVFESTIEAKTGNDTTISERNIYIVEDSVGGEGHLYWDEPGGITYGTDPKGASTGKTAGSLSPKMRELAKTYGDTNVRWALDSLPPKEVAALLEQYPKLLAKMSDISAADARDLLRDLGNKQVEAALKSGKLTAGDLLTLHASLGPAEAKAMLVDAGTNPTSLERVHNRAALEASGVLGQKLNKSNLESLGYRVDKNGIIYRPAGQTGVMEPLQVSGDKVAISEYESAAEVQARVYNDLPQTKQTAFDKMQAAAPKDTKVVLVEGVHDTGVTWDQVFGSGAKGKQKVQALTDILIKPRSDRGAGLSRAEAKRLIQGLLESPETLKVVLGTDPVRGTFDYRKGIIGDDIAHHFDPLYLGGGHQLIAALPGDAHDDVHEFFNDLHLPSTADPPGVRLQPGELQGAVRDRAQPAVVIVKPDGTVSYRLYNDSWKL